jgi:hypothetical protein
LGGHRRGDRSSETTAHIGYVAVVQGGGVAIGDRDEKWREIEGRWKGEWSAVKLQLQSTSAIEVPMM